MIDLDAMIVATGDAPWVWGRTDCTSWLAPHVEARLGGPVGAELRAAATDGRAARRLIIAHGGLIGLVDALLLPRGARRTSSPREGDVGVVAVTDGTGRIRRIAALRRDECWIVRTGDGMAFLDRAADVAWSLP